MNRLFCILPSFLPSSPSRIHTIRNGWRTGSVSVCPLCYPWPNHTGTKKSSENCTVRESRPRINKRPERGTTRNGSENGKSEKTKKKKGQISRSAKIKRRLSAFSPVSRDSNESRVRHMLWSVHFHMRFLGQMGWTEVESAELRGCPPSSSRSC